jgi:LysM domain
VGVSSDRRARWAPARALAGLLVPAGLAIASAVLGWAATAPIDAVRAPGPAPVDALLAVGAALACAGLLALLAVGATVTLVVVTTGRLAGRCAALALLLTPHVVRAAVGLLVGATVVSGQGCPVSRTDYPIASAGVATTTTAAITPAPSRTPGARPGRTPQLPPGWSPDRPAAADPDHAEHLDPPAAESNLDTPEPTAGGSARRSGGAAGRLVTVVVHRGDTLWDLAARHLGPGATDAQVATEWPRWHATNRSTIGPDPDLILPGQRLRVPIDREESR